MTPEQVTALAKPFPPELVKQVDKGFGPVDYVDHAHVTERLNHVMPGWTWSPMARTDQGLPVFDDIGGLWIWLELPDGTQIPGYGEPGQRGHDAIKGAVSDAIKNAAMRLGVALDLWKGKPAAPRVVVETSGGARTGSSPSEAKPTTTPLGAQVQRTKPTSPPEDPWATAADPWGPPVDPETGEAATMAAAVATVVEAIPGTEVLSDTASDDAGVSCQHGAMKFRRGFKHGTNQAYEGYFCSKPKGESCKPVNFRWLESIDE